MNRVRCANIRYAPIDKRGGVSYLVQNSQCAALIPYGIVIKH